MPLKYKVCVWVGHLDVSWQGCWKALVSTTPFHGCGVDRKECVGSGLYGEGMEPQGNHGFHMKALGIELLWLGGWDHGFTSGLRTGHDLKP